MARRPRRHRRRVAAKSALDRCARLDTTSEGWELPDCRSGNLTACAGADGRRARLDAHQRSRRRTSSGPSSPPATPSPDRTRVGTRHEQRYVLPRRKGAPAHDSHEVLPCFGLRRTRWITTCKSKRRTGSRSLHGDPRCVRWISTPQSDPMCGRDEMHVRRVLHVPTLQQMQPHGGLPTNPPKQLPTTPIQRPRRRAPELAGSPLQRPSLAPASFAGKPRDRVVLACRSTAATPVIVHLACGRHQPACRCAEARSTGVCADADAGRCGP